MNELPSYTVTIKRKTNWFIVFFVGIWFFGLSYMLEIIIRDILDGDDRASAEIIGFVVFFGLVTLFGLKMLLWQLRGKERISVVNGFLKVEKQGTFLAFADKYDLRDINGFHIQKKKRIQSAEVFWGLAGGKIRFKYKGRNRNFGQTLTKSQAVEITDELNERLRMAQALSDPTVHPRASS